MSTLTAVTRRDVPGRGSSAPTSPSWWISGPPGCGPCRQVAPLLEQLAAEYEGRVKIVKGRRRPEPRDSDRRRRHLHPHSRLLPRRHTHGHPHRRAPEACHREKIEGLLA